MKWNPLRSVVLASAACMTLASSSAMAAIVLVDASFESNNIGDTGAAAAGVNSVSNGWTSSNGGGATATYLVDNGPTQNTYFNSNVLGNGQQSVSLWGGYISQQLNDDVTGAVMTGTVAQQFDISFYAAARKSPAVSNGTFSVILQAFNGSTYVGNLATKTYCLGTDSDGSTIDLGLTAGNWYNNPISLSLIAPENTFVGNNIRLVFASSSGFGTGGAGGEAAIDNVSIVAVPEPSVALLGGLGVLALLRRRRN